MKSKVVCRTKKESAEEKQELALLEVMNLVKTNDLPQAIKRLEILQEQYPEHEADYLALLEMARRRQDAQSWYRFQDWTESSRQVSSVYVPPPSTVRLKKRAGSGNRLEELKRQTWFVLSCRRGQN